MLEDRNIPFSTISLDILKDSDFVLINPANVLKLIYDLDICTSLDESFYFQHIIKKRDGSHRVLQEPKPNLKSIQKKILELLYLHLDTKNKGLNYKYKLVEGITAYRKNKSVIDNANFHVGQEFLFKLDIKDFFNSIDTHKLEDFWVAFLHKIPQKLLKKHVFTAELSDEEKEEEIKSLAIKLVYITSINYHLAQGSPTSGVLANYYLSSFDNRLLNYCIQRRLTYSRYSDDLTISGNLENFQPGLLLGAVQFILKERGLKLNKSKTKLLKGHRKQIVTGIVVNVKKTAGREYKRTIRQDFYYLKKFKESHIVRKGEKPLKYVEKLLGKISWIIAIEKDNSEFKSYKGELAVIFRFLKLGKTIQESLNYFAKLSDISEVLRKNKKIVIDGIEWQIGDENLESDSHQIEGTYVVKKRGKKYVYFDEIGLKNYLPTLSEGWRLPTIEEFKSYLKETHYDDRHLLGLRVPSDPSFNGVIINNSSHSYNKAGGYWTSNMEHIPKGETNYQIGRNVFLSFSKKWNYRKHIRAKINFIGKTTGFSVINKKRPIFKQTYSRLFIDNYGRFTSWKDGALQSFSVRLVRSESNISSALGTKVILSNAFWKSVSTAKKSPQLDGLGIEFISTEILKDWRSSSLLLSNNKLNSELEEFPPVLRLDLENNELKKLNFNKVPKTVRHLLLAGNDDLESSEIPMTRYLSHLHELTLPNHFDNQFSPNFGELYQYSIKNNGWIDVDSDATLSVLIDSKTVVKHLKISVYPGSELIDTKTLFQRLSVFEELISLQIVIEPADNDLCLFLSELKNKSYFSVTDLEYIDAVKLSSQVKTSESNNGLTSWLYKKIDFVASDLVNRTLKNLIIDFTWFAGAHFEGDFNLKLERYHLLHPGTLPFNLPATSSLTHQPNILLKIIGTTILQQSENLDFLEKSQKLVYLIPFNRGPIYYIFNDLVLLYPKNQIHLENIVLVMTNWEEKKLAKGKVLSLFKKYEFYQLYQLYKQKKTKVSRCFFNFPLLSYSLNFDVYRLSNPTKTILFKDEIQDSHFILANKEHPLGLGSDCLCYENERLLHSYDDMFYTDDKKNINTNNRLLIQSIFPNIHPVKDDTHIYNLSEKSQSKQYVVSKGIFSESKEIGKLDKQAIIDQLKENILEAMHLPKNFRKDFEVMTAALVGNPFSFVFAHTGLKQDVNFIVFALKRNLRTLLFLDAKLVISEYGRKILEQVYNQLASLLLPHEFNFVINQLSKKISVKKTGCNYFEFDSKEDFNIDGQVESLKNEMISWTYDNWYSMSNVVSSHLLTIAKTTNFFNSRGYYTDIKIALLNVYDCDYLDLSYISMDQLLENSLEDIPKIEFLKLTKLNISFSGFRTIEQLPVMKYCEELYLDGLFELDLSEEILISRFPNLKRLYVRCTKELFTQNFDYKKISEYCLYLELIDARSQHTIDLEYEYRSADNRKIKLLGFN